MKKETSTGNSPQNVEAVAAGSQAVLSPGNRFPGGLSLGRLIGLVVGAVALLAGIGAVLFVDWSPTPPPPPKLVRPVKTALVVDASATGPRRFRGVVVPGRTADLSFQVGGKVVESHLDLGREAAENSVLARLDTTPFDQQIAVLTPAVEQARIKWERLRSILGSGGASQQEVTDAKAAYDEVAARLKIAQQDKVDSVLRAPFRALVVQRFAEKSENVQADKPVARLQDISTVDIAVSLTESVVARYKPGSPIQLRAEFPVLPGKSFPVTVKEASAEADPRTGLYRVVYTMARPQEATILPGMAAAVVSAGSSGTGGKEVKVPIEAVFADAEGRAWVWVAVPAGEKELTVSRIPVTVARVAEGDAVLSSGPAVNQTVVTAGVHFLREGQRVRPMEGRP